MCEANAYIVKENEKILLMESVDKAEQEGNGKVFHSIYD